VSVPDWPDWGTVPAWVSAGFTGLGVVWAVSTFGISSYRERRRVANSVVVTSDRVSVTVDNSSASPIIAVRVTVKVDRDTHFAGQTTVLAGARFAFKRADFDPPGLSAIPTGAVTVRFSDPLGYTWARRADGRVRPVRRWHRRG
jgi:hypothetical protein